MIKVLIVDDSKVIQEFLDHLLSSDPEIKVVGIACSGSEAIELVKKKKPDIITMDVNMPLMDGYKTSRLIMETYPTPIVIVSGIESGDKQSNVQEYVEAGALAIILRPAPFELDQFTSFRKELITTVKLMSEIKVVKLYPKKGHDCKKPIPVKSHFEHDLERIQVIAIGASTGGPLALQIILSRLTKDLPVPVLIVQHIAPGFVKVFQKMLSTSSGIELKIAEEGETLSAGIGYIAPDNFHMGVSSSKKIALGNQSPENGSKPSVSYLFRSIAEVYGSNALGILLTGMGKDGAGELKDMKNKGAITVVQNQSSSVVFGMPGEALKLGASTNAFSPEKIADMISKSGLKN